MKGPLFISLSILLTTVWVTLAQLGIDERLVACARKTLSRCSTNEIFRAFESGLWNSNKTAIAIAIPKPKASILYVFLRQTNGDYGSVDVSRMEGANIAYIGPDRHYDRIETAPLKWWQRDDGLFEIQMRTRAWSAGRRYTGAGTLVIRPDGFCVWR